MHYDTGIILEDQRIHREKAFHDKAFTERPRRVLSKYYSVIRHSRNFYQHFLKLHCKNKRVLEYGCGTGSFAFILAQNEAIVTGIDISKVGIVQATEKAKKERLDIDFKVMNAEDLEFADNSFDLICGTAILHHLNLDKAFLELSRVLEPNGKAIFFEALGHNPLINFYRKITPDLRTKDEHPLLMKDIRLAENYFGTVETHFFHLSSLIAIPVRRLSGFTVFLNLLDKVDRGLFKFLPFLRKYAWVVILILSQPNKPQSL